MSVQSTGKWGFTYHRAFEDVDTKMHTKNPQSKEAGFRYYVKSELKSESEKNLWKSFKAAVLMLIGKTVKIDGKDCIIGRRSFKEFITRVVSKDSEFKNLKTLDMQACIDKLVAFQKKPTEVVVIKEPVSPPKNMEEQAEKLADHIRKSPDPVVQRSPSMQNLERALVEFGHHPDDQHAENVERALEAVEQREPEAVEHLESPRGGSRSPSREARAESTSREAEAPKSEKQKAMERLTDWRGNDKHGKKIGFDWGNKGNLQRGLQEVLTKLSPAQRGQFEKDIKHWNLAIKGDKIVRASNKE